MNTDLDSLLGSLPPDLKEHVHLLLIENESKITLENLVKFILGSPHPTTSSDSKAAWEDSQSIWKNKLNLIAKASQSAKRSLEEVTELNGHAKKPKLEALGDPLFTIHAISCSTPLRKKLDVTISSSSISLVLPSSGSTEVSISLEDLNRAFLLPTPGKAKPHYTIILMNDGTSSKDKDTKSTDLPHIIFGIDATLISPLKTTAHTPTSSSTTHPKSSQTLPILLEFFSHLPSTFQFHDASRSTFRSSIDKSECGITAYLGAKEGHLYFFKDGILWGEKKPCLWYAVGDLENAKAWTVTGRNASLYLEQIAERELGEDEPPASIEFGMIDGREIAGIQDWIANAQPSFGCSKKSGAHAASSGIKSVNKSDAKEKLKDTSSSARVDDTLNKSSTDGKPDEGDKFSGSAPDIKDKNEDEEDESDEDFAYNSDDSDGGEPSSDLDSDSGSGSEAGSGQEAEESGEGDDGERRFDTGDDEESEPKTGSESEKPAKRKDSKSIRRPGDEHTQFKSLANAVALEAASMEVDELDSD